jgi:hypothetical protein
MTETSNRLCPIGLGEFNARTHNVYGSINPYSLAIEHWTDQKGVLLGVIVLDRVDRDYAFVVLGRDEKQRFRAIDLDNGFPLVDEARDGLHECMTGILERGATTFPQRDYAQ